jgi:hypothetical protein
MVAVALVAIAIRFFAWSDARGVRLPRIVDDSIGMWVVRRLMGRPVASTNSASGPLDPFAPFRRPTTVLALRVDARVAALLRASARGAVGPAGSLAGDTSWIGPAWSVIERPAPRGRAFGSSILPEVGRRPVVQRGLRLYATLATLAVVLGFALGAGLAVATR